MLFCFYVFFPSLTAFVRKAYAGPFRPAIKCFSLSEDFLSPVAFSINSSQTDKSSYWPSCSLSQQLFPAGTPLPGPQIRYEAGRLSLLADEGCRNIDNSLHSLLGNKARLAKSSTGLLLCNGDMQKQLSCAHTQIALCTTDSSPPPVPLQLDTIYSYHRNVLEKFLTPHVLDFYPCSFHLQTAAGFCLCVCKKMLKLISIKTRSTNYTWLQVE